MIFSVYILYSEIHKKTYVGYTSNLISRIASHNTLATKGYTIAYRPWEVIHVEYFQKKKAALFRDKALKSGKGREYIKNEIIPFMKELGFISAYGGGQFSATVEPTKIKSRLFTKCEKPFLLYDYYDLCLLYH